MVEDGTQLQTQSTMGGQEGITGDRRAHLAVSQDEVREDREHRFARGALDAPDEDSTQTDARIMRVPRQAPTAATGRLVGELKAQGQDKGEDELDKRLAIVKQAKVSCFIVEIDGDSAIVPRRCGCCAQVSPPEHHVSSVDEIRWGVRHYNIKKIVREAGRYHEIRWSVDASSITQKG
jgi:hypothetical protein